MDQFDRLEREAAAVDAGIADTGAPGAAPGAEAPPKEPKPSTAEQLDGLLKLMISKATEKFPSVGPVWNDEKRAMFCMSLGPLLDKHAGGAVGFFEKWGCELYAAVICVPLLWLTARAMRADAMAAGVGVEKEINPAPGSNTPAYDPHAAPTRGVNPDGVPKS